MAYTANDAFCAVADVEARLQRGAFGVSTNPTQQQVLDAMARRAVEVEEAMLRGGQVYTVPSRSAPFGTPTADGVLRLKIACEYANAIGAAVDAVQMHDVLTNPEAVNSLVKAFITLYDIALKRVEEAAASVTNPPTDATVVGEAEFPFDWSTEF